MTETGRYDQPALRRGTVVAAWNTHTWAGAILLPYSVWMAVAASLSVGYALRN